MTSTASNDSEYAKHFLVFQSVHYDTSEDKNSAQHCMNFYLCVTLYEDIQNVSTGILQIRF